MCSLSLLETGLGWQRNDDEVQKLHPPPNIFTCIAILRRNIERKQSDMCLMGEIWPSGKRGLSGQNKWIIENLTVGLKSVKLKINLWGHS